MGTPPLSAQDFRAAAEVHRELSPEYSDAVVESFMAKIEARLDERLAKVDQPPKRPLVQVSTDGRHYLVSVAAIGIGAAGVLLSLKGVNATLADGRWYATGTVRDLWIALLVVFAGACGAGLTRLIQLIRRKH